MGGGTYARHEAILSVVEISSGNFGTDETVINF